MKNDHLTIADCGLNEHRSPRPFCASIQRCGRDFGHEGPCMFRDVYEPANHTVEIGPDDSIPSTGFEGLLKIEPATQKREWEQHTRLNIAATIAAGMSANALAYRYVTPGSPPAFGSADDGLLDTIADTALALADRLIARTGG